VTPRRLTLFPLGGGAAGVLWGLSSGSEAVDSAVGTGILGLAAGALVAIGWHAVAARRQR
jgi:hypothetical protein